MLCACFRIFLLSALLAAIAGQADADLLGEPPGDDLRIHSFRSGRSFLWNSARRLFGSAPPCGPPEACPPHHCRLDDAVVHGFCCGCSHPTDRVQVRCPPWLQCPLSPVPLCDDYNWMMDCCC